MRSTVVGLTKDLVRKSNDFPGRHRLFSVVGLAVQLDQLGGDGYGNFHGMLPGNIVIPHGAGEAGNLVL